MTAFFLFILTLQFGCLIWMLDNRLTAIINQLDLLADATDSGGEH